MPSITPELRREIALNFIMACTDAELEQVIAEARPPITDVKALLHREMQRQAMALTDDTAITRNALGN